MSSESQPIFTRDPQSECWRPVQLASGPFVGLQGGAVAGLLTAEIEALSAVRDYGVAVSCAAWFFKPTPMSALKTQPQVIRAGGRMTIVDNTVWAHGDPEPYATVRVTLLKVQSIEVPDLPRVSLPVPGPAECALQPARAAPYGGPWLMDAMEVRVGCGIFWFRLRHPLVENAGVLARVLGPADWAHGIGRPVNTGAMDPNPNLTVHLARTPIGDWIGVSPHAFWEPKQATGAGRGVL